MTSEDYSANDNLLNSAEKYLALLTKERDNTALLLRQVQGGDKSQEELVKRLEVMLKRTRQAAPDLASYGAKGKPELDLAARELVALFWQHAQARKNVVTSGFSALDEILSGGFEAQRLVMVLGAPNTGKTTFSHQMSEHIASSGRPVLYITSEDTPSALLAKTLARLGGIPYSQVLKGAESVRERINQALAMQLDRLSADRLRYLDATNGLTLDLLRDKSEQHLAAFAQAPGSGPGVIVVDYLQRLARAIKVRSGLKQDLREVVTMLTEHLRALAVELDCTVLAISAQNRTNYARGDAGAMASAKESGDIEYTCDVLMALSEDKDKNRVTPAGMTPITLFVDKNRQGQRGKSVELDFWPDRQQFTQAKR